jgi:hypothetical protein
LNNLESSGNVNVKWGVIMSVILVACMENFALMMCDGRMVEFTSDNKKEYKIADENIKKIFRVNKDVCIGIGGDAIAGDKALKELNGYNPELLKLEKIEKIIREKAMEKVKDWIGIKIIIAGRNRKGLFTVHILNSENGYIGEYYEPKGEEILIKGAFPDKNYDWQQLLDKHLYSTNPWGTSDNLKKHMRDCIINVSELDKTVNTNIFEEMIT